jgi:hypothetical protein
MTTLMCVLNGIYKDLMCLSVVFWLGAIANAQPREMMILGLASPVYSLHKETGLLNYIALCNSIFLILWASKRNTILTGMVAEMLKSFIQPNSTTKGVKERSKKPLQETWVVGDPSCTKEIRGSSQRKKKK